MVDVTPQSDKASGVVFDSSLLEGRQRFLAYAIEHAFAIGRRTPKDFVRHFPPAMIMEGLADQPEIRGAILEGTTGLKSKIATKKSWQSAGEDLQIALAEGETTAEIVVNIFERDDRVRYLDTERLWAFLVEGEFWTVNSARGEDLRIAKQHIAFLLERALAEQLVTHAEVIEGITVTELASRLPKNELGKLIETALAAGRKQAPFTEVELWSTMTAQVLVDYVPLTHLWSTVIDARIAQKHGFSSAASLPKESDWVDAPEEAGTTEVVSEDDFA